MKVHALVAAAGPGSRMGTGRQEKPFMAIKGVPVLARSISVLDSSPVVDEITVMVMDKHVGRAEKMVRDMSFRKVLRVIPGGATRTDSVRKGLEALGGHEDDIVLVHDGARPLVTRDVIERVAETAKVSGAAVPGVRCVPTIKKVDCDGIVMETLDRDGLREVQTPQAFRLEIIRKAYSGRSGPATDDAALVEMSGRAVSVVEGSRENIKITTPFDLVLAEAIIERRYASGE